MNKMKKFIIIIFRIIIMYNGKSKINRPKHTILLT
jgi:hypothetical protein